MLTKVQLKKSSVLHHVLLPRKPLEQHSKSQLKLMYQLVHVKGWNPIGNLWTSGVWYHESYKWQIAANLQAISSLLGCASIHYELCNFTCKSRNWPHDSSHQLHLVFTEKHQHDHHLFFVQNHRWQYVSLKKSMGNTD